MGLITWQDALTVKIKKSVVMIAMKLSNGISTRTAQTDGDDIYRFFLIQLRRKSIRRDSQTPTLRCPELVVYVDYDRYMRELKKLSKIKKITMLFYDLMLSLPNIIIWNICIYF